MPEDQITTTVDVREFVDAKRAAMVAHASQIPEDSFFLQLPLDAFHAPTGVPAVPTGVHSLSSVPGPFSMRVW